ncbi:MAG: tyrosine-type recombinase/integrase [Proteobacteria bacterium]|nr:tyrosine-type recombinase/integrase [Pseudomonadota bacterium]
MKLALKSMSRAQPARQRQARALSWSDIEKFLRGAGEGLQARREKAMLCVAYDTMARRRELVALNVEDLHFEGGSGTALIRRSKTDQAGEGALAYLSYETVREVRDWLQAAEIKDGALFRGFVGRRRLGERLHADQVADIFKRVARWLGLPASEVAQVSGHSIRVGAAQDLLALNIDLASIMQAGRWKDTRMPMRYAERVVAARGGMARAARAQGRDGLS